jgi:hypothetical protein
MPASALPKHLQLIHPKTGKIVGSWPHWDYPKLLNWIPRGWTAFNWGMPKMVFGNQKHVKIDGSEPVAHPKPVGEPGSWQVSKYPLGPWYAWYLAFTTKGGWHFRIGARWDDQDNYVQFPTIARRHLPPEREDTSTGK